MDIKILKIMNKNINLCQILKGHEGETFWSDVFGLLVLIEIHEEEFIRCRWSNTTVVNFYPDGSKIKGERCTLFPSKDQRDWNKWIEEQNSKVPKTWSELSTNHKSKCAFCEISERQIGDYYEKSGSCGNSAIERSALALLKIHQLIEIGYGGNITDEENYYDDWTIDSYSFIPVKNDFGVRHICFHTKEQAYEFLSYPENIQLLRDYFM